MSKNFDVSVKITYNYRTTITGDDAIDRFGTIDPDIIRAIVEEQVKNDYGSEFCGDSEFEDVDVDVSEY